MSGLPVGIQLYTVRDKLEKDFAGTLRAVAEMGYAGVEFAGHGPLSPADLKALLQELGLQAVASHEPINTLEENLPSCIEFCRQMEIQYVVCPWMPEERRKDAAGWKATAALLEEVGKKLRPADLTLCYHNHSFEFQQFEEGVGFDLLYENSSPEFLKAELDVYWIRHGGRDPVKTTQSFRGRCPLIHVKDMAADADRSFTEVGTGVIDMPAVFRAAEEAGAAWMLVEQDVCKGDSLESARTSLENLKKLGLA